MKYTNLGFKTASVVGIGISNRPLIGWLTDRGIRVTARDIKPRDKLEPLAEELEKAGVTVVCGEAYLDGITDEAVFRAPGIRFDKPQFLAAAERGALITSEMELFFELCPCPIIGVTGSDGKTTTTTVIGRLLERAFPRVFLGGNIGEPLLPKVEEMSPSDIAAVELSSFQLQTMKRSPNVAVITNITPNHLDYHLDMDEYIQAKSNIFRHQRPGGRLVLNAANEITRRFADDAQDGVEVVLFGEDGDVREQFIDGRNYICRRGEPVLAADEIRVPGHHNVENYMAVIAALEGFVPDDEIRRFARSFGGVEHRIELVCERDGVKFYNSSIDSSPARTIAALESFDYDPNRLPGAPITEKSPDERRLIVIMGGYDKKIPFEPLSEPLCRLAKAVVFTGAAGEKIKQTVTRGAEFSKRPFEYHSVPDFDEAVRAAAALAKSGDIVILSPACASFDAFPNFMARGEKFRSLICQTRRTGG
ncbi:MAG: UDP-N-acetylmuramoyl-L-alanine--D-glutamate ligase [Clostridiales bacterium]|nr:UDP-N-acetylmuramoyl-L-alanine--D-glutamate ligase [Clostridiales bacterium]